MQKIKSNTFCVMPWMSLNGSPDGDFKVCCFESRESKGLLGNIDSTSLSKFWNSKKIINIRKKMLHGENILHCKDCYKRESMGLSSMRLKMNKSYNYIIDDIFCHTDIDSGKTTLLPLYFDIRFSNICNLACRMCGSEFSSGRISLDYILNPHETHKIYKSKWSLKKIPNNFLQSCKTIYIAGGEPFLDKDQLELVMYLHNISYSRNIYIIYNTNLTFLNEGLLAPLLSFRKCKFIISCDGYGETFERIRIGAQWKNFLDNYKYLCDFFRNHKKNIDIVINCVIQRDNILDFYKLYIYAKQELKVPIEFTVLTYPEYLSIENIPNTTNKTIIKFYKKLISKYRYYIPEIEYDLNKIISILEKSKPIKELDSLYISRSKIMDKYYEGIRNGK